jgi:hypothetical protein
MLNTWLLLKNKLLLSDKMKFFSHIVVILRFYVSFLPLLPPNFKWAIPF